MLVDIFLIIFGVAILFTYFTINQNYLRIKEVCAEVVYLSDNSIKMADKIRELEKSKAGKVYLLKTLRNYKTHSKYEEDYYGPTSYGS